MKISIEKKTGYVVFHIEGNIELFQSDTIGKDILKEIHDNGYIKVILDLSGVDYVDSMAIAAFLDIRRKSGPHIQIRICGLKPSIEEIFVMTKLSRLIPLDSNENESLKQFIS